MKSDFLKQFSQYVYKTDSLGYYYTRLMFCGSPTLVASEHFISLSCENSDFTILLNTTDHQEAHEIYERVLNFYKEKIK